ncbi:MAG: phytanoyl-CoA dioxygenase family protein [Alphaproteobacteria bacterium]|nr:phytanoyl-CoA dioxygenase family protein [Alphaproteobacteria bacterium]
MTQPTALQIRQSFDARGFTGPLPVMSTAQALAARRELERFEAEAGSTDRLHMKSHLYFAWLWNIAKSAPVIDYARQLLGDNVLILASRLWIKEPGDMKFVSWHQDTTYFGLDPDIYANMWIALSDASEEAGCMRFIEGSHLGGLLEHETTHAPDNLLTRGQTVHGVDITQSIPLPLKAGECSIHHGHVLHNSPPNASADRRIGFGLSLIPTHVRSTIGRRSATLLCGEDTFGHWDLDPLPVCDRDPAIYELMHKETKRYVPAQKLGS